MSHADDGIFRHVYASGLVLVAEPIVGVESVALSVLTPAGFAAEPQGRQGVAAVLGEMVCRGAGGLDARAHSEALDQLGVQRGTSAETTHLHLGATLLGRHLGAALPLLTDMLIRPTLAEGTLGPSVDLALQSLDALEDEPQQKVFIELRRRHYPRPFARSSLGERADLESLTLGDVRGFWRDRCVPGGAVVGVAGRFDWDTLRAQVESATRGWSGARAEPVAAGAAERGAAHLEAQTAQVHIGLAYDAPPETHADSVAQRVAVAVLSGGSSGRLFTEVREKRGLCYSVYAAYSANRDRGAVLCYAGTTAGRAHETLDVMRHELEGLSRGVGEDEFRRAVVGMKSRLVMQGESTAARAHAIAVDDLVFGRPRPLRELAAEIDAVTPAQVNAFLKANPVRDMTIVTIGPGDG